MAAPVSSSTLVPRPRSSANAAQGDLASAQFRDFYGALAAACQTVRQLGEADAEVASRALSDQLLQLIDALEGLVHALSSGAGWCEGQAAEEQTGDGGEAFHMNRCGWAQPQAQVPCSLVQGRSLLVPSAQ